MAPQHQATARRSQDISTGGNNSNVEVPDLEYTTSNKYSDNRHFQAEDPTVYENNFNDSGFVDSEESEEPVQAGNIYEDFILFEDDSPFIDEDASMIVNHGSVYRGGNNERSAYIHNHTSYNYSEKASPTSFREAVVDVVEQDMREAVDAHRRLPNPPSLFSNFEATTGPSMFLEWATTGHRHEIIAYRYEQPPYPSDRQQSPQPSPAKRRRVKSGTRRRRH